MITPTKKYQVTIFGETYTLVSDESEAVITSAAQQINTTMTELASRSAVVEQHRLAVLAALKAAITNVHLEHDLKSHVHEQNKLINFISHELCDLSV